MMKWYSLRLPLPRNVPPSTPLCNMYVTLELLSASANLRDTRVPARDCKLTFPPMWPCIMQNSRVGTADCKSLVQSPDPTLLRGETAPSLVLTTYGIQAQEI